MSEIMFVEQSALTFASKAANGPPAMQLPTTTTNKQQPGLGKRERGVGSSVDSDLSHEWMHGGLPLPTHKSIRNLEISWKKKQKKKQKKTPYNIMSSV